MQNLLILQASCASGQGPPKPDVSGVIDRLSEVKHKVREGTIKDGNRFNCSLFSHFQSVWPVSKLKYAVQN